MSTVSNVYTFTVALGGKGVDHEPIIQSVIEDINQMATKPFLVYSAKHRSLRQQCASHLRTEAARSSASKPAGANVPKGLDVPTILVFCNVNGIKTCPSFRHPPCCGHPAIDN